MQSMIQVGVSLTGAKPGNSEYAEMDGNSGELAGWKN